MLRVALPGGVDVALRPVGGEDEAWMLDTAIVGAPSVRATALVARCLVGEADAERTSRALTVGDREALLLHLRRATLGDVADCVLTCPAEGCGERMELELHLGDLLLPRYADAAPEHELKFEREGARFAARFRLPTADDLDDASELALHDPDRAADGLLRRCVVRVSRNGDEIPVRELPLSARDAISAAMAAKDPQAEIELGVTCPSCGAAFGVVFDTAMFFLQELEQRASRLLREVHVLASHYHWSEHDILRMPPARRSSYLELIAESAAKGRLR